MTHLNIPAHSSEQIAGPSRTTSVGLQPFNVPTDGTPVHSTSPLTPVSDNSEKFGTPIFNTNPRQSSPWSEQFRTSATRSGVTYISPTPGLRPLLPSKTPVTPVTSIHSPLYTRTQPSVRRPRVTSPPVNRPEPEISPRVARPTPVVSATGTRPKTGNALLKQRNRSTDVQDTPVTAVSTKPRRTRLDPALREIQYQKDLGTAGNIFFQSNNSQDGTTTRQTRSTRSKTQKPPTEK